MRVLYRSFASRLTRRVMLTVFVTMIIIAGIIFSILAHAIKAEVEGRYQVIMNVVSEKLGSILLHEEICARNLFSEVWNYLDSPEGVMASMERQVKLNNYAHGYYMAFEPGYYPQYPRWFEPYMKNDEEHARNIGSAEHDYLSADWYNLAKGKKAGFWTDPYFDEKGGQDKVCSFCMPLYDSKNQLAGIYGTDMSLSWLVRQLQEIDDSSNSNGLINFDSQNTDYDFYTFIINRDGTYIAHPDKERVLKENVFYYTADDDKHVIRDMTQMKRGKAQMTIDGKLAIVYYAPLESTNWSMAIVVPRMAVMYPAFLMIGLFILIIVIGLLIVWLVCRSNIRQISSPLSVLAKSAEEVSKGNFDTQLPFIEYKDEVCELRDSFATMQQSLVKYIADLKMKTAKEAALDNELQLAKKLQISMIPDKYPPFPERTDIDIFGLQNPAKVIGGDIFDFFIRDEQLFFCIGDVSGKGIPAALMMTVIHFLFRIVSAREDDPKKIVELMNNYLAAENKSSMFCTYFLGVLDLKTYLLNYCNAGHELPILITDKVSMVEVEHNLALGLMENIVYKPGEIQLSPGDVLLVLTDGIKEATNQAEECFEKERMKASLQKVADMGHADAAAYIHHLVDDVTAFVGDAPQSDDLTLLAIRIRHD